MTLNAPLIYIITAALLGVGAGFVYLILTGSPSGRPRGALAWGGLTLSLLLILTAGSLGLMTATGGAGGSETNTVIGEPAPPLTFRLVGSNEKQTLSDYRGKVVLLNLWATWCPPCLDEIPELNQFQDTYGPRGVVVVTISDERRATIQRFEEEQLKLKTVSGYLPEGRSWPKPYRRVRSSRPYSFVIDPEGAIQNMWAGAEDYAFFARAVGPHLPAQSPSPPDEPTPAREAR